MKELIAFLGDARIGVIRRDRSGRLTFEYDEEWRARRGAVPLSLSMPLAMSAHGNAVVAPFLWGLLPDNEVILDAWAKRFQVSARNPFALLRHVGQDCAGAVRFATPEDAETIARSNAGRVEWLDERAIGDRLRLLKRDVAAWRASTDAGQFSLGGAQPKTALLHDGKRWGLPSGRLATTHIIKPDVPGLEDHAHNEHFCLQLAAELGLPVAASKVHRFDGESAIVVARYDRVRVGRDVVRIHQEDLCQALSVHPTRKYENEGGPGAAAAMQLLASVSRAPTEDRTTFVQALGLNWVIAGTDAHAKNYSLLLGAGMTARLAPLYDIASVLPYDQFSLRRLKLSMKIGGKYRVLEIGARQWQKLSAEVGINEEALIALLRDLTRRLADLASTVRRQLRADGLKSALLNRLAERISARAVECAKAFD